MKSQIILIGGGGHCKSCIDVIEQEGKYQIGGIVDLKENLRKKVLGYEIIATDDELPDMISAYDNFIITIGQIKNPTIRITLFQNIERLSANLPVIISPHAYVSKHAKIGAGTVVMHQALINAGAHVGKNCIINNKALIEHDARVGDHCHISTAAVINGGVKIDSGTFVGSNATTREYVEIGKGTVIGCNTRVLMNISDGKIVT
jgi:sugar O-acyltransferase (sialic acid O-acetyltransferase NeuD family)